MKVHSMICFAATVAFVNPWSQAGQAQPLIGGLRVPLCNETGFDTTVLRQAEATASSIFSKIGVTVYWTGGSDCPAQGIRIQFVRNAPDNYFPGALAYARPYEGVHIEVFYNRVRETVEPSKVPALLAHVLAHEIGHVLEGTNCHSEHGIMKARWDANDYYEMARKPLGFSEVDLRLIRQALDARGGLRAMVSSKAAQIEPPLIRMQ